MGLRLYKRKSVGQGFWLGAAKGGVSAGRRGRHASASLGSRGLGGSFRLLRGISYTWRKK